MSFNPSYTHVPVVERVCLLFITVVFSRLFFLFCSLWIQMLAEGCSPTEETNWPQCDVLCGGVLKQQAATRFLR